MAEIDKNANQADLSNENASVKTEPTVDEAQQAKEVQELNAKVPTQSSNSSGGGAGGTSREEPSDTVGR